MSEFLFGEVPDGTVPLTSINSDAERMVVEGLLQDNGIPYFFRDHGAGGYFRLFGGFSVYGADIRVSEADYERAKELIDAYVAGAAIVPEQE